MITQIEAAATIESEEIVYLKLAQMLDYPGHQLLKDLFDGSLIARLSESLMRLGLPTAPLNDIKAYIQEQETSQESLLLELEMDYTRLCFASRPRVVPFFESFYNDGKMLQGSTYEVTRIFYEAGLHVEEEFSLPPDHISLEMEFLAYLCYNENKAIREGDDEKQRLARRLRRHVLKDHLAPFAVRFADAMKINAKTPLYEGLAEIMLQVFARYSR